MDFALKSIFRSLFPVFLGVLTLTATVEAGQFGNNRGAVGGVIGDALAGAAGKLGSGLARIGEKDGVLVITPSVPSLP